MESGADRVEWAMAMRANFSPAAMLNPDASIDQSFFRPKQVLIVDDRKWGPSEQDLLYEGIEAYGVGRWREVREALLPEWEEAALRGKAARALGSQSLARYAGWKGDRPTIDAERALNKEIGTETGCWKAGMLVEDAAGSVAAALQAGGVRADGGAQLEEA